MNESKIGDHVTAKGVTDTHERKRHFGTEVVDHMEKIAGMIKP